MSVFLSYEREKTIPETVKGTHFFFSESRRAKDREENWPGVLRPSPSVRRRENNGRCNNTPTVSHLFRSRSACENTKRNYPCRNTPAGTKRNDHRESTRASPSKGTPVRSVNRSNPIAIPGSRSGRDAPHFDPLMPHPAKTNKTSAVSIKKVPFR